MNFTQNIDLESSLPLKRPKKSPGKLLRQVLNNGGPGYLQFAITNICNARCAFCGFSVDQFDRNLHHSVTLEEAKRVIDVCVREDIGYLLFMGGEPLVHRDLSSMVRYAAESGISPMICTNGALWTDRNMRMLATNGLSSVIMSVDAADAEIHEKNRGLPGNCQKIKHANLVFSELGIQTTASITASKLIDDYNKLPEFLSHLGFNSCTFSYPITSLSSGYMGYSNSNLVTYTNEELISVFDKIKELKAQSGFRVINPSESLSMMQKHVLKETERFGCLAGHKYFYLDWNLNLYRCHAWHQPICKIEEFDRSKIIRDGCTKCMMDCYRDASVLQFIAVNISDTWKDLCKGHWVSATKRILDKRNLISLKAVWEDRKWIRRV